MYTTKKNIELILNNWEISTIIKLLEHHKKWDKQTIIDQCNEVNFPIDIKLAESLNDIEIKFEELISKFSEAQKNMPVEESKAVPVIEIHGGSKELMESIEKGEIKFYLKSE